MHTGRWPRVTRSPATQCRHCCGGFIQQGPARTPTMLMCMWTSNRTGWVRSLNRAGRRNGYCCSGSECCTCTASLYCISTQTHAHKDAQYSRPCTVSCTPSAMHTQSIQAEQHCRHVALQTRRSSVIICTAQAAGVTQWSILSRGLLTLAVCLYRVYCCGLLCRIQTPSPTSLTLCPHLLSCPEEPTELRHLQCLQPVPTGSNWIEAACSGLNWQFLILFGAGFSESEQLKYLGKWDQKKASFYKEISGHRNFSSVR